MRRVPAPEKVTTWEWEREDVLSSDIRSRSRGLHARTHIYTALDYGTTVQTQKHRRTAWQANPPSTRSKKQLIAMLTHLASPVAGLLLLGLSCAIGASSAAIGPAAGRIGNVGRGANSSQQQPQTLVVFGDSLSDNGNRWARARAVLPGAGGHPPRAAQRRACQMLPGLLGGCFFRPACGLVQSYNPGRACVLYCSLLRRLGRRLGRRWVCCAMSCQSIKDHHSGAVSCSRVPCCLNPSPISRAHVAPVSLPRLCHHCAGTASAALGAPTPTPGTTTTAATLTVRVHSSVPMVNARRVQPAAYHAHREHPTTRCC